MAITKQFGPSSVSYGDAVYRSGQNQERFTRAMLLQNQGASATAAKADAQYKLGMLDLEKDKWAKQWPLLEKEMDLREVETWLSKSVEYFKARATAASARLSDRSNIFQLSSVSVQRGEEPIKGSSVTGPHLTASGNITYGVNYYSRDPSSSAQYSPYMSQGASYDDPRFDARVNARTAAELSKIDEQYRAELARIDEVFGVSQGWTPKLFMTGAPEEWNAPPTTPAFGQDPLTGTKPRNDPGASETPFV